MHTLSSTHIIKYEFNIWKQKWQYINFVHRGEKGLLFMRTKWKHILPYQSKKLRDQNGSFRPSGSCPRNQQKIGPYIIIFLVLVIFVTYSHSFAVTSNASVTIVPPPLLTRKVQVVSHFKGDVPLSTFGKPYSTKLCQVTGIQPF